MSHYKINMGQNRYHTCKLSAQSNGLIIGLIQEKGLVYILYDLLNDIICKIK